MIGLLALAAAVTAAPSNCSASVMYGGHLSQPDMAQCYLSRLTFYPELVRFRNVRMVGDQVCGEVSLPLKTAMSGFKQFAFRDTDVWARVTETGYDTSFDDSTEIYAARAARYRAKGQSMAATAELSRKRAMETRARELLATCG